MLKQNKLRNQIEYLFDLQGYVVLEEAVPNSTIKQINEWIDDLPKIAPGEWYQKMHRLPFEPNVGELYENIIESNNQLLSLVNHKFWFDYIKTFIGDVDGIVLAENLLMLRDKGGAIKLHSGGHKNRIRTRYNFTPNGFLCGEVNVLLALTNIGIEDGPTVVVPGSHKSNLKHPELDDHLADETPADGVLGGIMVEMEAGDALIFTDSLAHGAAEKKSDDQRRIVVFRYSPASLIPRMGFFPSADLLSNIDIDVSNILCPVPIQRPPCDVSNFDKFTF